MCAGWLAVPDPGGLPPRASGAEGERDSRGDVNCEGQRGSASLGDGHHSQTSAHQHAAWVLALPFTFITKLMLRNFGKKKEMMYRIVVSSFLWPEKYLSLHRNIPFLCPSSLID